MTAAEFEFLLQMIRPIITKQHTKMRWAISPRDRLSVTLRFLATGESARAISAIATALTSLVGVHFVILFLMQAKNSIPSVHSTGLGPALFHK